MTEPIPRRPQAWRLVPLVLLAAGIAVLIAWVIRDRAAALGPAPRSLLAWPAGSGHHAGSTGITGPPSITRERVPNYAGITFLAAHLTFTGVLIAAALSRRLARRRVSVKRPGVLLAFAGVSALFAGVFTVVTAKLSVGNAISFGQSLAAAVTVVQYAFVLALITTVLVDLRLCASRPEKG